MSNNKILGRAEIITALRCCGNADTKRTDCEHCPLMGYMCVKRMLEGAADLLERDARPNDPLTLTELRGMDGEPVWVEEDGAYQYGLVSLSGCALEPMNEVITLCNGYFYLLSEMAGNYEVYPIAFRRKPEGGGE